MAVGIYPFSHKNFEDWGQTLVFDEKTAVGILVNTREGGCGFGYLDPFQGNYNTTAHKDIL